MSPSSREQPTWHTRSLSGADSLLNDKKSDTPCQHPALKRARNPLTKLVTPLTAKKMVVPFMNFGGLSRYMRSFSTTRVAQGLENLAPAPGSTRQQNRVGRGPGSGRGKTSGRGQKGQWARASVKPWFEGGQTPITRLFPKVGFRSKLPQPATITIGRIQQLVDEGRLDASRPITMRELYRSRAVRRVMDGIKLLGAGSETLKQPLTISASQSTGPAREAIAASGGTFVAQYYTRLGMRALTRPEATLKKFGRLPLRARPTDRRNIEYYRDPEHQGYLVGAPDAPQVKQAFVREAKLRSPLQRYLADLMENDPSEAQAAGFSKNKIVS